MLQSKKKIANNMSVYYRHLTVNFNSYVGIKQPNMTDKDKFYKVYSPEQFRLKPRDDIYLDLKFDIQTSETIELRLNLLLSLKALGLQIENEDWASNKTKDNIIHCIYLIEVLIIQQAQRKTSVLGSFFY